MGGVEHAVARSGKRRGRAGVQQAQQKSARAKDRSAGSRNYCVTHEPGQAMTAFDLSESIQGIHGRLVAQLDERRKIPHPTHKGDEGEFLWLNVLSDHLPRRYAIRRGIVIDSQGARSDAIDLIVYDPQYTPVFLAQDEHAYVLAEAVYAVFEVKYELNAANVRFAADKAASVRRLFRTNATVPHAGGEVRKPKPPFTQIAGLLTLESNRRWVSPEERIRKHVDGCDGNRALDLVLSLRDGLYESNRPTRAEPGVPPGVEPPSFETGSSCFVLFLYSLLHRLQRMATVPAVEWGAYRQRLAAGGAAAGAKVPRRRSTQTRSKARA